VPTLNTIYLLTYISVIMEDVILIRLKLEKPFSDPNLVHWI